MVVVGCFLRKPWVAPPKNKFGQDVPRVSKVVFERCNLVLKSLQRDLGNESYNQNVERFLRTEDMRVFLPSNAQIKAGQVEQPKSKDICEVILIIHA